MTKEIANFLLEVLGRVTIGANDPNFEETVRLISESKKSLKNFADSED